MPVYAIAQLTITDRATYNHYISPSLAVFNRYQGRLFAADESPALVGGKWNHQKVVLMSIPDKPSFRLWATSPTTGKSQRTAVPFPPPLSSL